MGLKKFLPINDTRLLLYDNCLFKVKVTFCQSSNAGVECQNSSHLQKEIEEVVCTVVSIIKNERPIVMVKTQHFMVSTSVIPWHAQQKLRFCRYEKDCQVFKNVIRIKFAPRQSVYRRWKAGRKKEACAQNLNNSSIHRPSSHSLDASQDMAHSTSLSSMEQSNHCKAAGDMQTVQRQRDKDPSMAHSRDRHVVEVGDLQEEVHLQQLATAHAENSAPSRKPNSFLRDWVLIPFKRALSSNE